MSYPTSWARYCGGVSHVDPSAYGLSASVADINRWAARYRAAKAFRGILLDGYSESVQDGYSALCRVVFTWSAFERFLPIVGLTQDTCVELFNRSDSTEVAAQVASLDSKGRFYDFVHARANARHKAELERWRNREPHNFTHLDSAIRHIFAHGHLTPSVAGMEPAQSSVVCNLLCDHMLNVMDAEFTRRIESFYE